MFVAYVALEIYDNIELFVNTKNRIFLPKIDSFFSSISPRRASVSVISLSSSRTEVIGPNFIVSFVFPSCANNKLGTCCVWRVHVLCVYSFRYTNNISPTAILRN